MPACAFLPRGLIPGLRFVGAIILILFSGRSSPGETYELRYAFAPGESFAVSTDLSSAGTIASPTSTAPFSLRGQIIRDYQVSGMDPGRVAILEPVLDSASFHISVGTSSLRLFLTPDRMDLDGQVVWSRENQPPSIQLLPFLHPSPVRLDPLGRRLGQIAARHEVQPEAALTQIEGRLIGSNVLAIFSGEREVFPPLPEKQVEAGEVWSARVVLGRVPQESTSLVRDGTYTAHRADPSAGELVEIEAVERTLMLGQLALLVEDHFVPKELPPDPEPTPTPRSVERERIRFRRLDRTMKGTYLFDPERGRPLSANLTGSEQIDLVSVRYYHRVHDTIPLSYSLESEIRLRFEYPETGSE
jgi:hypothetical protein